MIFINSPAASAVQGRSSLPRWFAPPLGSDGVRGAEGGGGDSGVGGGGGGGGIGNSGIGGGVGGRTLVKMGCNSFGQVLNRAHTHAH